MFGHRSDGRRIKGLDPLFYAIPHLMPKRTDAHVFTEMDVEMTQLDRYVKEKRAELPDVSHMSVLLTAMGRVLGEVPQLNRFVVGRRIFARKYISVCFNILSEVGPDDPREDIIEIHYEDGDNVKSVTEKVAKSTRDAKEAAAAAAKTTSGADKLLKFFFHLPNFILSWLIRTILWFDRRGMLLKSIIDLSPFHASAYLTNMASLGMNSVFHHIYDAGTVSMFLAMGKREFTPVYGRHGLEKTVRTMKLRFTVDERVCSGYVFSRAFKLFDKYLTNPELLEEPMQHKEDIA